MDNHSLSWALVDQEAQALGAGRWQRLKWRQSGRSVPSIWRIRIVEALMKRGVAVSLSDFDRLEPLPGRIAA